MPALILKPKGLRTALARSKFAFDVIRVLLLGSGWCGHTRTRKHNLVRGGIPDCIRNQALDHAVKVCKSMVLTPDELLETGGCLMDAHRTCPTSTRIEGYSAALTFLPNVTMAEKALVRLVEYN